MNHEKTKLVIYEKTTTNKENTKKKNESGKLINDVHQSMRPTTQSRFVPLAP